MPSLPRRVTASAALAAALTTLMTAVAVPALAGSAAARSGTKIVGPDVSSYQHPGGAAINWTRVHRSGASFAIVKATEGTNYVNPYFASDYAAAARAKLVHGAYHFARPATPVASSARVQAQDFAATLGDVNTAKTLPPALDLEVTGGLGRAQLINWAQDFLLDVRQLTGRTPLLYTYPNFWSSTLNDPAAFQRYPIWMASYSTVTPGGATLWQFTSTASVRGIRGNVDMSRYVGADEAWPWATVSNGTVATPWTASRPGPPQGVYASLGTATKHGATAVVHWLPGDAGTAPISGYTVTASSGRSVRTGAGATSAKITGLKYGQSYTFKVRATNQVGTGRSSRHTNTVTPLVPTAVSVAEGSTVTAGQSVTLTAKLTRTDTGEPLAGQTVQLLRMQAGQKTWHRMTSATTNSGGLVYFPRKPHRNTSWQLAFAGGHQYAAATATVSTPVRPAVTMAADDKSVTVGQWVHLSGTIYPTTSRIRLIRQVLTDGTWVTAQQATRTAGAYRFAFRLHQPGKVYTRVYVGAAGGRVATHTRRVGITAG